MNLRWLEDGNGGYDSRKIGIIISVIAAITVIGIYAVDAMDLGLDFKKWDDVSNYYQQYLHLANGEMPYRDFMFEYPPLAMVIIGIPGLLSFNEDSFGIMFTIFSTVAMVLSYYYLAKLGRNLGMDNKLIALMLIFNTFLLTRCFLRLETFLLLTMVLGFYLYSEKRYALAFTMMAVGVMFKLVTAIFAIAMIIPFLVRKDFVNVVKYTALCAAICALVMLPFLLADSSTAFDFLKYHKDRGLQIESVAASFLMLINLFVPVLDGSGKGFGSMNLIGDIPDAVASVMTYVMIACMVGFIVWVLLRFSEEMKAEDNTRAVIAVGIVLMMLFIGLNKVFSAQYVIWVLPFIPLLISDYNFDRNDKSLYNHGVICLAFTLLVTYPFINLLTDLHPAAIIVLLVRNIVFMFLIYLILRVMVTNKRSYGTDYINNAATQS